MTALVNDAAMLERVNELADEAHDLAMENHDVPGVTDAVLKLELAVRMLSAVVAAHIREAK